MKLEKMTKEQLMTIINEQNKEIEHYEGQKEYIEKLQDEIALYKYLNKAYVPVMEENQMINNSISVMQERLNNLQDLCDRQQKIIDNKIYN